MEDYLSFGEREAGVSFNPAQREDVAFVKSKYAEIIDFLYKVRKESKSEDQKRWCFIAITDAAKAKMAAVESLFR
ncbi:MAG: hypothetical protein M9904_02175 [Chitinophagaceae bacterium]|nr:hypothetical protein [Chitinophagaceae bacterium]